MKTDRPSPPCSFADVADLIEEAEEHIQNAGWVLAVEPGSHDVQPNDLLMLALCNLRHARTYAKALERVVLENE